MNDSNDLSLDGLQASMTSTPPVAERPLPNFLKFFPSLIQDLWKRGVDISMDAKDGELLLDGFYDNGPLRLRFEDDRFKAIDKRGKIVPITCFDDLVAINFEWWKAANAGAKSKKYTPPNRPWLDAFKDKKLVKRSVIYVENDGQGDDEV